MNRLFILFFLLSTSLVAYSNEANYNDDEFVVVLDAGHGGHDPGNLGNGYLEKNIALNIVLKVGEILERNPNIKVIYTRKDDSFVDLFVRGEIANKANANLFVSVHCDSHSSDAHGAGTFVLGLHANKQNFEIAKKENSVIYLEDNYETRYAEYNINSPESIIGLTIMQEEFLDQSIALAKEIQDNFSHKLKRKNREVKQAGFIVLHQTFMPSVLIETGFLTNNEEGAYLNSGEGQSEMGSAIAEAILNYKNENTVGASRANQSIIQNTPEPSKEITPVSEPVVSQEKTAAEKFAENPTANPMTQVQKEPEVVAIEEELPVQTTISETPPETKEILKVSPKSVEQVVTPARKTNIIFKVQIMASRKNIDLSSHNFNGLHNMSKENFKEYIRYMYGIANSYDTAEELKRIAESKGYAGCYIVAYQNENRISVEEALKLLGE